MSTTTMTKPPQPPSMKGLNHIKLPAHSIAATYAFYTDILPFTPLPQFDHFTPDHKVFAKMCCHTPSKLLLEIRYRPGQAAAQKCWDPVTFGVATCKDLEEWAGWLDTKGIKWVLVCQDPDEKMIRFYVEDEEHAWTSEPDRDAFWLGETEADPNL